jgi:NAD(P)-dependent dehydrogenase (short-subunit alcohol dehydrogenase family)
MEQRKISAVTGASGGIGRATAVAFAEHGFDVALLARGGAGLEGAAKDVENAGQKALVCPTDVADFGQVDAAAARIEEELGPITVWVNDAMTTVFSRFDDIEPDEFKRAMEVTFLGQVWGTRAALARMRPRDQGTIVNVGSALAYIGIPLQSPYCAAKFACRGFFESLRAELIHEGSNVRLSMVHMPAINTPQFDWCKTKLDRRPMPVPPIYQPEVAARFVIEAALNGRRAKIVGSWNKLLVGAAKVAPGLGNQFAALGAWESQLTERNASHDDPVNLWQPADDRVDYGAHGRFDAQAGGFLEPSFLKTLPRTAKKFGRSARRVVREKFRRYRRPTAAGVDVYGR